MLICPSPFSGPGYFSRKKERPITAAQGFAANQRAAASAGQWEATIQANFTGWTNQGRHGI